MKLFSYHLYRFSTNKQCYYKLLNVSTDASNDDIKASFFDMAKRYHPDMNPHTSVDPEKFRQIQEAYATLSNEEKRKYYDEQNGIVSQQYQGNPTFGEEEDNYQKFMKMNKQHIRQNEKEFTEYFDQQYFKNKDYFKRKVDEDDHWNFSEKLFMKHQKIVEEKNKYVLHNPFMGTYYWEKKVDMEDQTKLQSAGGLLFELRYLIFASSMLCGCYWLVSVYNDQNQNKQSVVEGDVVRNASGYRVKLMPINIA